MCHGIELQPNFAKHDQESINEVYKFNYSRFVRSLHPVLCSNIYYLVCLLTGEVVCTSHEDVSNCSSVRLLVTVNVVPSSPIVTLKMEVICIYQVHCQVSGEQTE
jgi:hypothetical protein